MLFKSKKLSFGILTALALGIGAAAAHAENPAQLDVGAFSGFPTNPGTKFLDNIGNVTGSADPINGNLSVVRTLGGKYDYTLFNNCAFSNSALKKGTGLTSSTADNTQCLNWFVGDVNVTTRIHTVSY